MASTKLSIVVVSSIATVWYASSASKTNLVGSVFPSSTPNPSLSNVVPVANTVIVSVVSIDNELLVS